MLRSSEFLIFTLKRVQFMFLRRFSRNISPTHRVTVKLVSTMNVSVDTETGKKIIREGQAEIRLSTDKVFYNPVQEFNRDLSIAVLSVFTADYIAEKSAKAQERADKRRSEGKEPFDRHYEELTMPVTILEPLSATGLRAIRYAKEIPNVHKIIANDISKDAVEVIKENIVSNNLTELVDANHDDACMVMYKHKDKNKRFTAIDLDPYGCPSIFLDAAVQAVQDGGLLLVTATDMAILAGNAPETCHAKYGAVSLKTKTCHEMALRILLQCIESHANRYGRYIVPQLSISADFYIRVFVKVFSGQEVVKKTTSKLSMVYQCCGCGTLTLHQLGDSKPNPTETRPDQTRGFLPLGPPVQTYCEHCNSRHRLGGPIWSAPIHEQTFVNRVLEHVWGNCDKFGTSKRLEGALWVAREELTAPLYYTVEQLFGTVHLQTVKMSLLRSAILNAGYKVSYSHAWKNSVKTDAPPRLVWDILRSWGLLHPPKQERIESDPVAKHIMSQSIQYEIDWTMHTDANPPSRHNQCLRFQPNPAPYWGPGSRSAINVGDSNQNKQIKNQNTKRCKRKLSPASIDAARKKSNDAKLKAAEAVTDGDKLSADNNTEIEEINK